MMIKISDLTFQWITIITGLLLSIVTTYIVAKNFSFENYSLFSQCYSLGAILLILFDFGNKSMIFRSSIKIKKNLNRLNNSINVSTVIFFLSIVVLLIAKSSLIFITTAFCFFLINLIQFKSSFLKGSGNFYLDLKINIFYRFFLFVALCLQFFYLKNFKASLFFNLMALSLSISFIFIFINDFKDFKFKLNFPIIKKIIYFFLIDICIVLYFRADILIMSHLDISDNLISNYSISHKVFEFLAILISPICIIFYRKFRLSESLYHKNSQLLLGLKIIILIGIFVFFINIFFFEIIVNYIFDFKFKESANVVYIMNFGTIFMCMNSVLIFYFFSINEEKNIFYILIPITLFSLTANFCLLNTYGYIVSAYVFVINETLLSLGLIIFLIKKVYK